MKLPRIDLKELEKQKQENREERLAFMKKYVAYLKTKSPKKWSKEQKKLIE